MPFMFDLVVDDLTPDQGRAIADAAAATDAWPVRYTAARDERRWYGIVKHYPAVLDIAAEDERGHVLVDPADWNEEAWALRPDAAERVALLVELLDDALPQGFSFQATWAGSPVRADVTLTAAALGELVRRQQLNDHTRYRVRSR